MDNIRARMFNKRACGKKFQPEKILWTISPSEGQVIADIGAGGGYYTFRFAERVTRTGKVFSIDSNRGFLDFIEDECESRSLMNVCTLHSTELGSVPDGSLDLVFMRNVYHHLQDRVDYFKSLSLKLKEGGRVVIIDYRRSRSLSFVSIFGHNTSGSRMVEELEEAGFLLVSKYGFLKDQNFMVFELDNERTEVKK